MRYFGVSKDVVNSGVDLLDLPELFISGYSWTTCPGRYEDHMCPKIWESVGMRALLMLALLGLSVASSADDAKGPWWDRSDKAQKSLPQLVHEGWRIVAFDAQFLESPVRREYILHHPDKSGAWQCSLSWFMFDDGSLEATGGCSPLLGPGEGQLPRIEFDDFVDQ